jgi:quercetin dioxygenase-like cupin family protein
VNKVRFAPGARSAWHSHALGQTLFVIDGSGRAQARGEAIIDLRPGASIYTPPDQWHWHGADPDHFMAHLSITEGVGDEQRPESVWGALVTDAEYRGLRS